MRRRVVYCLIALMMFSPALSVDSSVSPHAGTGELTLKYWDTNGTDTLRAYLLSCQITDGGIDCDTMKEDNKIFEALIDGDGSQDLKISGSFGVYRVCVRLKDSGRQDCDSDNYYLLQGAPSQTVIEYVEIEKVVEKVVEARKIEVDILSLPTEVQQNTTFSVGVNITNPFGPLEAEAYSYVYNGSRCVSGGWTANSRTLMLGGDYTVATFNNTVFYPGLFKLKVRVKYNSTNYDSQPIELLVNELRFSKISMSEVVCNNGTLRMKVSNTGNIGANATVMAEALGVSTSFYIGAGETKDIEYPAGELTGPATVMLFSGDVLQSTMKLSPPSLVSFAVASEFSSENFLFAMLSTLTLGILGVAIWKR